MLTGPCSLLTIFRSQLTVDVCNQVGRHLELVLMVPHNDGSNLIYLSVKEWTIRC